jgi:NDP-4-keto-2,6-dideoxyhexose 3-C-methyltransferase
VVYCPTWSVGCREAGVWQTRARGTDASVSARCRGDGPAARRLWTVRAPEDVSPEVSRAKGESIQLAFMNEDVCVLRKSCRICGSSNLRPVIDLGEQHLASLFVTAEVPSFLLRRYPLEVVRCAEEAGCGLVQLRHTISPKILYAHYGYRSGTNEIMRANLSRIAADAGELADLRAGDTVLDIGCNDGTLLDSYQRVDLDRLGFDPATNVTQSALEKGLDVVGDFFSYRAFAAARPGRKAKVVTSLAMFYDLEDPRRFVRDVAALLAEDGVWVLELSYLPFMLRSNAFDTICHEHLEYYLLRPIEWMLRRERLQIGRIEFNDINGGSFRLYVRKQAFGPVPEAATAALDRVRRDEEALRLDGDRAFADFRRAVLKIKDDLLRLLAEIKAAGRSVYVYGASTKGNTLLQFCGIDRTMVVKAADRNPEKWGRRTLGTGIPIASEEEVRAEEPDFFLVLPWHFFDGFRRRERAFLERGGKFILPLPQVRVVGLDDP